ncbi:PREDICTED: 4-coumarate--CoA ligase 1-like [Drosophila arizonae]|uniref:4-coumarate--CoA ligase 1-like n=1 Tax=Drosophila arizonae TaxID=7263 RepID=A0ABM1NZF7_DROAR|nr:PREDICTED: 4-coumarate--CoA ligase 1-like [Drosophila arizonae]
MPFKPEIYYEPDQKVWSGSYEAPYFSPDLSVGEITFWEMQRHTQLIAQISASENTTLTRGELFLNSQSIATYMRNLGMYQSDIVGIIARNTTHMSAVVYACLFNGIAFHPLNVNYMEQTIEKLFEITQPKLIFCDGDEYDKVKAATTKLDVKIITMRNHKEGSIKIDDVIATPIPADFAPLRLEQGNNQTLGILCSSGTTGVPKAVTNASAHKFFSTTKYLTTADVQYCHSTLDWVTGFTAVISSGVHSTLRIISAENFDPTLVLNLIEKYKITWLLIAPSHMAMLANSPDFEKIKIDSLKHLLYGGMCCSLEVQQRIRKRVNKGVLQFAYGFSELGSTNCTLNKHYDEKPNSVGRILPGQKLKIVNENGEALEPNQTGEICINPCQYWPGYYRNPTESRMVRDRDGWFHTGDSGYVDNDGFLYISGRIKDMLKFQNIMYYPSDIEDVITQMPGVAEVCVFGIHSDENMEEAAASVVPKRGANITAEDVVKYVKDHVSTNYLQLHAGALIVDDIKRQPNGKTSREATKKHFIENYRK